MHIRRIVSGGQSGVDRAALDAAIARGIDYGGWCPKGGWAEDLPEPPGLLGRYPGLRETPAPAPGERTEWNVRDSDLTLVLLPRAGFSGSPGTDRTVGLGRRLGRPVVIVDLSAADAVDWAANALAVHGPSATSVNVAGPRESESPGIYGSAMEFVTALLDVT